MDFAFDHVHLICKDTAGMAAYFERVFGGERILDDPDFHGAPNIVVKVGTAKIFCRGVRPNEKPGPSCGGSIMGLDHFSFTVENTKEAAGFARARGPLHPRARPQRPGRALDGLHPGPRGGPPRAQPADDMNQGQTPNNRHSPNPSV
ncbi:MAG: hypothetical protein HYR52_01220 [Candidatus Tectomicrobia bacterium]|nr:hypothetical protein [Candidatus Tectomicrobia bacterium]